MKTEEWKDPLRYFCIRVLVLFVVIPCAIADSGDDISLEGGDTTVNDTSASSYDHPIANLSNIKDLQQHDLGEEGFRRNFARSPIKGKIRIGPKFNNVSCVSCHTNNGRGEPKFQRSGSESVVKLSAQTGKNSVPGGPIPVQKFGLQLRDHSIKGVNRDGKLNLSWELLQGYYPDGTPYELRKPVLSIRKAKLPEGTMLSLRRPPPVFGAGLLDAIASWTIRSLSDPNDSNGDGISGKVNVVWDIARKTTSVGKFGWKAAAPTAAQQIATAYSIDMGVTNSLVRLGERSPDIDQSILNRTIYYLQTLAVPSARDQNSPVVQKGKALFISFNCNGCHAMTLVTGSHSVRKLSNQIIHPFTDLLLHDMGSELADNRPEFLASGTEWRTPPLWGIGLTAIALKHGNENYLHDGRARSLEEAILWHGGEAEAAKQAFLSSMASDRDALIQFLRSL